VGKSQTGKSRDYEVVASPAPILKWAGGKRALLSRIIPMVTQFNGTYIEPFLGAGALFFSMPRSQKKIGNDFNMELIELYRVVRDDPEGLLFHLRQHRNEQEYFYEVRSWDREPDFAERSKAVRAARLIFLNKTCFNGLYRVNSRNEFNVPFANLKNPDFISERNIRQMSSFLRARLEKSRVVALRQGDYQSTTAKAKRGDFVYLDPPYDPLSDTASFVSYQKTGFTKADQGDLKKEIDRLASIGVPTLLSNSDTPLIRQLFSDQSIYRITQVHTNRRIGADVRSRGRTAELLIDNYKVTVGRGQRGSPNR